MQEIYGVWGSECHNILGTSEQEDYSIMGYSFHKDVHFKVEKSLQNSF